MSSEIFVRDNINSFIEKIDREFIIFNKEEEFTLNRTKNITDANLCIPKTTDDNLNKILDESIKKSRRNIKIDFITINNSSKEILGVLICESTENDDIWAIDLICSKSGIGIYLIGCFLYCLKIKGYKKSVLLLAYGYANMQGFCLYSRFGFIESPKLNYKKYNSIYDCNNVKMQINLSYNDKHGEAKSDTLYINLGDSLEITHSDGSKILIDFVDDRPVSQKNHFSAAVLI